MDLVLSMLVFDGVEASRSTLVAEIYGPIHLTSKSMLLLELATYRTK